MLSPFDQSGEFLVARVNPSAELIGYFGVIGVALDELAQSAYSEGLNSYVEDEADESIELFLGEVGIDAVDFILRFLDVLL